MAAETNSAPICKKISFIGDQTVVLDIQQKLDDDDLDKGSYDRLMDFNFANAADLGEDLFKELTRLLGSCEYIVIVFSSESLESEDPVELYSIIFAVAYHSKPKCLLRVGVSAEKLPLGLQNFPDVYVESSDKICADDLRKVESHLEAIRGRWFPHSEIVCLAFKCF